MHRLIIRLSATICLLIGFATADVTNVRGAPVPMLRFTPATGFALAVQGSGWQPQARIVFWVSAGGKIAGRELIATGDGSFVMGINGVNVCDRPIFQARDLHGARARLQGPALGCSQRADVPRAQLHVVAGRPATPPTVRIYDNRPASVTMHLGDELYVWEPGVSTAAFRPGPIGNKLLLIRTGQTPPRACPQPGCDAGFYWLYVAIKTGNSTLDIAPACRFATPPCLAPDIIIRVVIS